MPLLIFYICHFTPIFILFLINQQSKKLKKTLLNNLFLIFYKRVHVLMPSHVALTHKRLSHLLRFLYYTGKEHNPQWPICKYNFKKKLDIKLNQVRNLHTKFEQPKKNNLIISLLFKTRLILQLLTSVDIDSESMKIEKLHTIVYLHTSITTYLNFHCVVD